MTGVQTCALPIYTATTEIYTREDSLSLHDALPIAAPAGMLVLTALAALGPAWRAGRLSAVQAIAAGRAPRSGRGYAAHRLAARLRRPARPVSASRRRSLAPAGRR